MTRNFWMAATLVVVCLVPMAAQKPAKPKPQAGGQRMLELEGHKSVALIMGNDAYPKVPLANAVNDAKGMAGALTDLGFQVDLVVNSDIKTMEKAVDRFTAKLSAGDTALFFYAGHGIQIDGENYLVPTSFDAKDEADAKYEAYSASRVQERMEGTGARVNIIILDACRNNPFRSARAAGGGLGAMNTGRGTFIAFATAPGRTASDNPKSNNGLFTGHLVESLRVPGLSIDQLFNRVRERVYAASGQKQLPWTGSSVIGEVYLSQPPIGGGVAEPAPLTSAEPVPRQARQSPLQPREPAATGPSLDDLGERLAQLAARAQAVRSSLQTLEESQRRSGLNLRGDIAASRTRMEQLMDRGEALLKQRDGAGAAKNLDSAEKEIDKLEQFLGR